MRTTPDIDFARVRRALLTALLACCICLAWTARAGAVSFEREGTPIEVTDPGRIATDRAGRVYVPLRGRGRVNIYDNARGDNRLLASIGEGRLQDPVSVAIDVRGYIYVADSAAEAIFAYSPYYWGAPYLGEGGSPGTALGQFLGLRQIAIDPEPRLYAAEEANGRVQSLKSSRGELTPLFAFGTSDPGSWGPLSGLAIDDSQRFIVSSADPGQPLRRYASNGAYLGSVADAGPGPGEVAGPLGLGFDPLDRLLVADTGNDRISLFSSIASGVGPLGSYGSGGPSGELSAPGSIAAAPGALLYVGDDGNDRIVRLRYDDLDRDGALDPVDRCPGLSDPLQGDVDSDGRGDTCDDDIDGDGSANARDRCPLSRPFVDLDGDGCQDPFSTLSQLLAGKSKAKGTIGAARISIRGRAAAGLGVAGVEVAIRRRRGASCSWYGSAGDFEAGGCRRPRFVRARGTVRWRIDIARRSLGPGRYSVYTRAVERGGQMVEPVRAARASFTVAR